MERGAARPGMGLLSFCAFNLDIGAPGGSAAGICSKAHEQDRCDGRGATVCVLVYVYGS